MTETKQEKLLIIGFGNPAREDDGLGPAAVSKIEDLSSNQITIDSDYQLTVEDAADIAEHDSVIFIDADIKAKAPFSFRKIKAKRQESFSSHSVEPEAVLALAHDLFNSKAEGYILGIRGYSFRMFNEGLTEKAEKNMQDALNFLFPILNSGSFTGLVERTDSENTHNESRGIQ